MPNTRKLGFSEILSREFMKTHTFPADVSIPDLQGKQLFKTQANTVPTTLIGFINPPLGKVIYIFGGSDTNPMLIQSNDLFKLDEAKGDISLVKNCMIEFLLMPEGQYREINRCQTPE